MGETTYYSTTQHADIVAVPFDTTEQAWFWFVEANQARNDGARFGSRKGGVPRPCEPIDILKSLERLYRNRMLSWDHILVLNHYGKRLVRPDAERVRETRASMLWDQAIKRLDAVLKRKAIVRDSIWAGIDFELEAAE